MVCLILVIFKYTYKFQFVEQKRTFFGFFPIITHPYEALSQKAPRWGAFWYIREIRTVGSWVSFQKSELAKIFWLKRSHTRSAAEE